MRWITLAALLLVVTPASAFAQEIPCEHGACVKKSRPGTHFIVELNGGGTLLRDGGFSVEGLIGAGGKVPFLPLRLYVISEFAYSTSHGSGLVASMPLAYRDERDYRDIALGLRLYLPLFSGLRLFADVLGGASHQAVVLEREELPVRRVTGWSPHAHVAAGLQYRLFYHLSLGVRAKVVLSDPDPAGLYAAVGTEAPIRTSLTAGLTWHF